MKNKIKFISAIFFIMALTALVLSSVSAQLGQELPSDLQNVGINSIAFSTDTPKEGDEITIFAEVVNNGALPVNDITVSIYVDSESIANTSSVAVEPNASMIIESKWTSEGGVHTITAIANVNGVPTEPCSEEITIIIGDVPSLVMALLVVVGVVLLASISPSIVNRPKNMLNSNIRY